MREFLEIMRTMKKNIAMIFILFLLLIIIWINITINTMNWKITIPRNWL